MLDTLASASIVEAKLVALIAITFDKRYKEHELTILVQLAFVLEVPDHALLRKFVEAFHQLRKDEVIVGSLVRILLFTSVSSFLFVGLLHLTHVQRCQMARLNQKFFAS